MNNSREDRAPIEIGFPSEWDDFYERNRRFVEHFNDLTTTMNSPPLEGINITTTADKVIFYLVRTCYEDFMEIFVLCGNGYGIGAMKLLRGMYERAVTAEYLHKYPDKASDFLDFLWIERYKLSKSITETIGPHVFSDEQKRELQERYESVKERFLITACQKCQTKKVNISWNKVNFVAMAKETKYLGQLIAQAYYSPTQQTHATIGSIFSRITANGDSIKFVTGAQRSESDLSLMTAHKVLLQSIRVLVDHFSINALETPLQGCLDKFLVIWKPDGHDDLLQQKCETS